MDLLSFGSHGAGVELLQLGLRRYGFSSLAADGIFGAETGAALAGFQKKMGLRADAVYGPVTRKAMMPWFLGYTRQRIRSGDSFYSLALRFGSSMESIALANPGADSMELRPGELLNIPFGFPVVPEDISYSSFLLGCCLRGLAVRFPFIRLGSIGRSVMGKPLWGAEIGRGDTRLIYAAGHHANEWIGTVLLLRFLEELAVAYVSKGRIFAYSAKDILDRACISIIPCVDPDGMDLVTGYLQKGRYHSRAMAIAGGHDPTELPRIWSANIAGTDLNLQYPAGWEKAREIKAAQGITAPAPSGYVGPAPLTAPEALALYKWTLAFDPELVLAIHSQGQLIYWQFEGYAPPGAQDIAASFSALSGYRAEAVPYSSGFAGYKDMFIQDFDRPGFTIEAGLGENPLPISQFREIYAHCLPIFSAAPLMI